MLLGLWIASVVIVGGVRTPEGQWLDEADVLARYLLAIPGALLAAAALMAQQRDFRARGMPGFGRDLVWAATALLVYGVIGQLFVRRSDIFPSTVINSALFAAWFGVPVQLLRALAAVVLLIFMMRALRAFEVESRRRLDEAARSEVEARELLLGAERAAGREREELNRLLSARARELGLLLDLSNLLSEPQALRTSLEAALGRVVDDLAFCDAAMVLLDQGAGDKPQVAASTGFRTQEEAVTTSRFGPSVALGQQAFAMGRAACRHADGAVIAFDATSVLRGKECWGYGSPSTLVALPLIGYSSQEGESGASRSASAVGRPAIGAVVFARARSHAGALSVDDLHLMVGIAQQVERSLETTRLYQEAQAREQTLAHLLRQVVGAQEAERRRIARELHDATGQSLSAIAMGLRGLVNASQPGEEGESGVAAEPSSSPRLVRQAESLQSFATDALGELRRIIAD
ncbi:MAG: histidine kinase, partial [Caldilineaceae bacterium]